VAFTPLVEDNRPTELRQHPDDIVYEGLDIVNEMSIAT
jgi:hypothetical protein